MEDNNNFLPFTLPSIGEEEINEVVDTIRSGWLTTGPKAKRFEEDFADFIGVEHALAISSATAGLHLALEIIGIGPGDKVVTTPYTFTSTAEVVRYVGADPVFVDIDPETFNIDTLLLEDVLGKNDSVKALIPVHLAGQACDMDRITSLAAARDIKVVEDAAHALPTSYQGKMIGTLSDFTVYSFYATKTIATGEGGMIVTSNSDHAERIKTLRLHGISSDAFNRYNSHKPSWYYEVIACGFKYNMSDIAAALGIHQLKKVRAFQKQRELIAHHYNDAFSDLPLATPRTSRAEDMHAWHLYIIKLELERLSITRDRFIELMFEQGIGTSVHFIPLHIHPYWRDRYGLRPEDFPMAYDAYQRAVSLPIYPKMSENDVERVIDAVRRILTRYST